MSSHYKLKATIDGTEVVGESLELTGNKSFKVFPVEKNETQIPIRGSAIVSILGKNHSISLNHKIKTHEDPEPSSTKWSYIENMYVTGNTPVATADIKNQDTAYVRASRGQTLYTTNSSIITKLFVSKSYTQYQNLLDTVGDFSGTTYATQYEKGVLMELFTFTMYYKYSTDEGGTVIPPVDDGTPASNKARIPCRPDVSSAPDWITNVILRYVINYTLNGVSGSISYTTWEQFIAFWDSIQTNPAYSDAVFHYVLRGTISFNELLTQRGSYGITISEIDNGKGIGIHGAKPLYLSISQQEGKNVYGASIIPASASSLDSQGMWSFGDMDEYTIQQNKLIAESSGTYIFKPKFRIKSSSSYYAKDIGVITGGSIITDSDTDRVPCFQYIGQPFIIRLFKETANGISKVAMRPYYKLMSDGSPQGTEFWKDSYNILGAQNFNPLQYIKYDQSSTMYFLRIRKPESWRSFLAGPTVGDYGRCCIQLIPMCIYSWEGDQYTIRDYIDGEGGPDTKGVNYVNRYTRYESAIGGADTPGQSSTDVRKAAFLKWPNEDGNNAPDHISPTGTIESLLSQMGKNWENWVQNSSSYKYLDRIMLVPVLWTEQRLEGNASFRSFLNTLNFGYYLLSPGISDAEIDFNPETIYRIGISGINIEIS